MNDEIKEMIEQMESIAITGKDKNGIKVDGYGLGQNELKMFLDYITNLQQLEQEHKKINGELREENSKLEIALQNIQEDYDRRVKEIDVLKEENNNKAMNDYAHAIDESWYRELYDDYKSRVEKAIEMLKEIHKILPGTYNQLLIEITQTLNILQNGDEEK